LAKIAENCDHTIDPQVKLMSKMLNSTEWLKTALDNASIQPETEAIPEAAPSVPDPPETEAAAGPSDRPDPGSVTAGSPDQPEAVSAGSPDQPEAPLTADTMTTKQRLLKILDSFLSEPLAEPATPPSASYRCPNCEEVRTS
jgi:hypothetical protein